MCHLKMSLEKSYLVGSVGRVLLEGRPLLAAGRAPQAFLTRQRVAGSDSSWMRAGFVKTRSAPP
ncbi:hypothetical protein P3T76_003635 [Phytophthora citrophthora]|uniref:Uncharacterized protein n=1 Tax=Phytophthora citrophthora TaxID=4793 RepID=A0AAD9GUZ1_9STRA|nr:hypothetical protein P3T76_003635 [Phytophthora citrophthora]